MGKSRFPRSAPAISAFEAAITRILPVSSMPSHRSTIGNESGEAGTEIDLPDPGEDLSPSPEVETEFADLEELLESHRREGGLTHSVSLEIAHERGDFPYREKISTEPTSRRN